MTGQLEFWQEQNIKDALALQEMKGIARNGTYDIGVGDHDVWEAVKGTYEVPDAKPIWEDNRGNNLTLRRYKTQFPDTYLDTIFDENNRVTARALIRFGEKANQDYLQELARHKTNEGSLTGNEIG